MNIRSHSTEPSVSHHLAERLAHWAAVHPDATAFNFLERGEGLAAALSFGVLHRRASGIAAVMRREGLAGQPVLLLYPPGLDFIEAFCACLYSGAIAVPAPYPVDGRAAVRSAAICRAAGATTVLTSSGQIADKALRPVLDDAVPDLRWIATDLIEAADEGEGPAAVAPEACAFLQFTSGSTGNPKGVMVTRGNLAANQIMIAAAFGHDRTSRFVTWLPMFHDMGLIGTVLQPIYLGVTSTLMSPFAFLQKPVRWLWAIDRWKGTTSGAPNFAYELCLRYIRQEQCAGLDLGGWRVAFCGAETVRNGTLRRFAEAFAGYGFAETAWLPCYGLAEATLFVAGGPSGTGVRTSGGAVSCGPSWGDQRIAIADPSTGAAQAAGAVGEIWLAGSNICAGYWQRPDDTAATFGARLAGDDATPYLRTGDLGFIRDGELFVTGRLKDVIIVRGAKHHPEEIEATIAASAPELAGGAGAVFAVDHNGEDKVVALHEVGRRSLSAQEESALKKGAEAAVNLGHGFKPDVIVLVRTGSLSRTTSGKIQRHLCRAAYLEGRLAPPAEAGA